MMLGDLGADVIKVERPGSGDETRQWGPPWVGGGDGRESAYFLAINRNKRSLAADFRDAEDLALVRRLAASADVLIENFLPGTLERWGLDWPALSRINPRLVHCTVSGYGSDGPEAGRPGYDFAVQARSGWMAITGEPEGEAMKVGVAVVDVLTGQNAAVAILAALLARWQTGSGQKVDVSLMDSAAAGLVNVAQASLAGSPGRRYGNAHATIVPYQAFHASDRAFVIAVGNDDQWRRFCAAAELDELAEDVRFATNPDRVENRDVLVEILAARIRDDTAESWLARLDRAGVPCAPIRSVSEALADPVLTERDGLWTMEGPAFGETRTVASPLHLGTTPPVLRRPPPRLGEHTESIREKGW